MVNFDLWLDKFIGFGPGAPVDELGPFGSGAFLTGNDAKLLDSELTLALNLSQQLRSEHRRSGHNELMRACGVRSDRVTAYLDYVSGFDEASDSDVSRRSDLLITSHKHGPVVSKRPKPASGKNLSTFEVLSIDAALLLLERRYKMQLMQISWGINTTKLSTRILFRHVKKYLRRLQDWLHKVFKCGESLARLEKGVSGTFHVHLYIPNVACQRLNKEIAVLLSKILIVCSPSEFLFNGHAPDIHITSGFHSCGQSLTYAAKRTQTAKIWNEDVGAYEYPECHFEVSLDLQRRLDKDLLDLRIACVYSRSELREFADVLGVRLRPLCNPRKSAPDAYLGNVKCQVLKDGLLNWKARPGSPDQSIHLQHYRISGHLLLTPSRAQRQPLTRIRLPADQDLLNLLLEDDRSDSSVAIVKRHKQEEKLAQRAAEKAERERQRRAQLLADREAEKNSMIEEDDDDDDDWEFETDDTQQMIQLTVTR
jgi:hypothetical protein